MNEIAVYVPHPDNMQPRLWIVSEGAALVGSPATPWFRKQAGDDTLDGRGIVCDYHDASASNVVTFGDRVMIAAERHRDHAPTHRRLLVQEPEALMRVGTYYFHEQRVEAIGGRELIVLARWVGGCGADPQSIDTDALHAELRRSSRAHTRLRR